VPPGLDAIEQQDRQDVPKEEPTANDQINSSSLEVTAQQPSELVDPDAAAMIIHDDSVIEEKTEVQIIEEPKQEDQVEDDPDAQRGGDSQEATVTEVINEPEIVMAPTEEIQEHGITGENQD